MHCAFRIPHSALKGTTPLRSLRDSQLEGVAKSPQATTKIKPRCEMRNAETAGGAFCGFCPFCGAETAGGAFRGFCLFCGEETAGGAFRVFCPFCGEETAGGGHAE